MSLNINNRRSIKLYYHTFFYYVGKNNTVQNIYLAICVLDTLFINYKNAVEFSNIHLILEISININKMVFFIIKSYKRAIKDKTISNLNKYTFKNKIIALKSKLIECEKNTYKNFENASSFTTLIETGSVKLNDLYAIIDAIIKILNSL